MATKPLKVRRCAKKSPPPAWTHVTVCLRIFRAKNDFKWNGNEIQCSREPLAERFGLLLTGHRDKVKCLKKKAVGQFAKEYNYAELECAAVFVRPLVGDQMRPPLQVDTKLQLEHGREYTLILYLGSTETTVAG